MLVRSEAMIGACLDEDCRALTNRRLLPLHFEDAGPLQNDVELVVFMGLLPIGLRSYEAVDPYFEAGGFVDDLVPTAGSPGAVL
jgi:hypothetical protein